MATQTPGHEPLHVTSSSRYRRSTGSDPRVLKLAEKLKHDFALYSRKLLRIVNKQGKIVPFTLNKGQMLVHEEIEAQRRETGKVRVLILKARQLGISTYVQGRYFWRVTGQRNSSAFVLSHLAESTSSIFRMVSFFYDKLQHPFFKPPLKSRSQGFIAFAGIESQYRVGTARTGQTGRGQTNQFVHGSEVAYYPEGTDISAGLLQTVGDEGTEVILESTANGMSGWFYEACMKALRGEGEYKLIFVPWFLLPEYARKAPGDFEKTEEEEGLAEEYDLSDDQLFWRRGKVAELGDDLFRQEYPATPLEAFLTTGRTFVEPKYLDSVQDEVWSPTFVGDVREGAFIPCAGGPLRVWSPPMEGEHYSIGVDVAEGLENGDYSCAQVVDSNGRQVACWHGHVDPWEYGDILKSLGYYYKKAWLLVERNNHGLTTLRRLQDLGYPNLYVEQTVDHAYGDKMTRKAGWLTTSKTKPLIIDNLAALIRQGEGGIADKELLEELRTYVIDGRGKTNAAHGCFDDRVIAYAIALFGLNSMPRRERTWTTRPEIADSVAGY